MVQTCLVQFLMGLKCKILAFGLGKGLHLIIQIEQILKQYNIDIDRQS